MKLKAEEKNALLEVLVNNILKTLVAYEHAAGVVNHVCHDSGMSESQFMIMNYVYDGGKNMGDIAYMLGVAKPNATPVVQALEAQGYIERKQDSNDRRMMIVTLTEKGIACHDEINEKLVKVIGRELGILNMSEIRSANNAVALLRRLSGRLMAPERYKA